MLPLSPVTSLSPLDGRYEKKVAALREHFSEYALIKARVAVEIEWLIALANEAGIAECRPFSPSTVTALRSRVAAFSPADAERVKAIEATTNHDVKAVEYWLREAFANEPEVQQQQSFIHFACTSEDINNLAHALMLKGAREHVLLPALQTITAKLAGLARDHAQLPMLAHTHGQPATPTTLGKEMANVAYRLEAAVMAINAVVLLGKINGATGNYNAHRVAYPDVDWPDFARSFVVGLGLGCNPYTIQIEPHDYMAALFDAVARANTVLLDFARDIWAYVSLGYFTQQSRATETGSSTMPHKVNPIDFENAEGNLGLANALLRHMAEKLPISRLQRDLSDSTVLRNMGVAFGYSLLAYDALTRGLAKLDANAQRMADELDNNWAILGEPIQTVMRKHGITDAYEQLKQYTRDKPDIDQAAIQGFIDRLAIPAAEKAALLALTPSSYLGYAAELALAMKPRG